MGWIHDFLGIHDYLSEVNAITNKKKKRKRKEKKKTNRTRLCLIRKETRGEKKKSKGKKTPIWNKSDKGRTGK